MWKLRKKHPIVNGGMNWWTGCLCWPILTYAYVSMLEKHNGLEPWSKPRLTSSPRLPDNSVTTLCVTKYLIKYFFVTHTTLDYPPINTARHSCVFFSHSLNGSDRTPCPWRFGSHGPSHHPKLSAQHRSKSPFHTSNCWCPSQVIWSLVP